MKLFIVLLVYFIQFNWINNYYKFCKLSGFWILQKDELLIEDFPSIEFQGDSLAILGNIGDTIYYSSYSLKDDTILFSGFAVSKLFKIVQCTIDTLELLNTNNNELLIYIRTPKSYDLKNRKY